ncbi:very-long-chain 3-oxoacyl-CoA reductase 1-like [Argentina anserina]|uniref:very-long-chain 3-oxoacyl-CoA reductase 1-like n=1 Tax=Argentina anserina TaxID=57926 RepID=UPI002176247E|nr:very-long-chain 3-oxoacyl-CoA reductase 1-like [Potentilla anserina]
MEVQESFIKVAITIGSVSVCISLINFLSWVYIMFLRPPKKLQEYGSWAIITGSAQGIGKALAYEMASKGLNIVLVDKNQSSLEATCNEIREKHGGRAEIKSIVMDLAKLSGEEIAKTIDEETKELDVGILINNAGIAYPYPKFFHEVDLEFMNNIIKVNMEAATWMTKAVLPRMLKKKKGAIVNIGSASTEIAPSFPLYTLYATTKAYLKTFSRCISLEYKQHGIDIQCQVPLFVATKLAKIKKSSLFIPSPETFSKSSIRWIGYDSVCAPYWSHSVMGFLARGLPHALLNVTIFGYFLRNRKRGQLNELQKKKQSIQL